jgi:hypothetical protein
MHRRTVSAGVHSATRLSFRQEALERPLPSRLRAGALRATMRRCGFATLVLTGRGSFRPSSVITSEASSLRPSTRQPRGPGPVGSPEQYVYWKGRSGLRVGLPSAFRPSKADRPDGHTEAAIYSDEAVTVILGLIELEGHGTLRRWTVRRLRCACG